MMTPAGTFVAYYRVSTPKQGRSGLGLDAQQSTVNTYLSSGRGHGTLLAEFTEIESGKSDQDRPKLQEALRECRLTGARLIVSRLDRLSRDVEFLARLSKATKSGGVKFVCADMPDANELTIHLLAVVAQHERELIAKRTREALQAAKARGVKLGSPRARETLQHVSARGRAKSRRVRQAAVTAWIEDLRPIVEPMRAAGWTQTKMAAALTKRGVRSPYGRVIAWSQGKVSRVLTRLDRGSTREGDTP